MKNASISVDVGSCVTRYILARPNEVHEEQLHYCTPGVGVGVSEMLKVLRKGLGSIRGYFGLNILGKLNAFV